MDETFFFIQMNYSTLHTVRRVWKAQGVIKFYEGTELIQFECY